MITLTLYCEWQLLISEERSYLIIRLLKVSSKKGSFEVGYISNFDTRDNLLYKWFSLDKL